MNSKYAVEFQLTAQRDSWWQNLLTISEHQKNAVLMLGVTYYHEKVTINEFTGETQNECESIRCETDFPVRYERTRLHMKSYAFYPSENPNAASSAARQTAGRRVELDEEDWLDIYCGEEYIGNGREVLAQTMTAWQLRVMAKSDAMLPSPAPNITVSVSCNTTIRALKNGVSVEDWPFVELNCSDVKILKTSKTSSAIVTISRDALCNAWRLSYDGIFESFQIPVVGIFNVSVHVTVKETANDRTAMTSLVWTQSVYKRKYQRDGIAAGPPPRRTSPAPPGPPTRREATSTQKISSSVSTVTSRATTRTTRKVVIVSPVFVNPLT
jgi:hypothetical protein